MDEISETKEVKCVPKYSLSSIYKLVLGISLGSYIVSLWLLPLFGKQPIMPPSEILAVIGKELLALLMM